MKISPPSYLALCRVTTVLMRMVMLMTGATHFQMMKTGALKSEDGQLLSSQLLF